MKKNSKILKGIVVSNNMHKTAIIKVEKFIRHSKYKKIIRKTTRYFVHDEYNKCKIGYFFSFKETAPMSKFKNHVLLEEIKK